jgi:hypothetical protein
MDFVSGMVFPLRRGWRGMLGISWRRIWRGDSLGGIIVGLVTRYVHGNFMNRDAIQTVFEHLTLFPMVW